MDHSLDAPADAKRSFEHQPIVDLTASDLMTAIVEELIVHFQFRLQVIAWQRRSRRAGHRTRRSFHTETLMRLDPSSVAEQLRSEQRSVARHVAVRDAFVFGMQPRIQSFAALLASQAFRVPVVSERLLSFGWNIN